MERSNPTATQTQRPKGVEMDLPQRSPFTIGRLLSFMAVALILKVTLNVLFEYRHYIPPDFTSDFLHGRETYFWGLYGGAFYVHLVSGPTALLLGMLLVSARFRNQYPRWHRRLGRVQAVNILLLVVPSGLWMAYYAATGAVAGAGLGALAIATATYVALGWRGASSHIAVGCAARISCCAQPWCYESSAAWPRWRTSTHNGSTRLLSGQVGWGRC